MWNMFPSLTSSIFFFMQILHIHLGLLTITSLFKLCFENQTFSLQTKHFLFEAPFRSGSSWTNLHNTRLAFSPSPSVPAACSCIWTGSWRTPTPIPAALPPLLSPSHWVPALTAAATPPSYFGPPQASAKQTHRYELIRAVSGIGYPHR